MRSGAAAGRWYSVHPISRISPAPTVWAMDIRKSSAEKIKRKRKGQQAKPAEKTNHTTLGRNVNFLVDIQAKMQAGKVKEYER